MLKVGKKCSRPSSFPKVWKKVLALNLVGQICNQIRKCHYLNREDTQRVFLLLSFLCWHNQSGMVQSDGNLLGQYVKLSSSIPAASILVYILLLYYNRCYVSVFASLPAVEFLNKIFTELKNMTQLVRN